MPISKLTERAVERLKAPTATGKQILYWDADLKGFGVLCSGKTNAKSYVVQRRLPSDKDRRVTIGSVHEISLKQAREAARALLLSMRQGKDPKDKPRTDPTLQQAIDQYLAAQNNLKPRSREHYKQITSRWLGEWLGSPLRRITADMAEAKHKEIQTKVAASGRGKGSVTANGALKALSVVWNPCAERDLSLPPNPTRRLKKRWFRVDRRTRHVRTDDLPKFYAATMSLPNPIHRDYVMLLLFTGLRRREAASLQWSAVDMRARTISIPAASTKSGRPLTLPMTAPIYEMLARREGREKFLFPSGDSKSGHVEEPKFIFKQIAERCGLELSAHDMRRTFITIADTCEISPRVLRALVNHAPGNDTAEGYMAPIDIKRLRLAANKVAAEIVRLCEPPDSKIISIESRAGGQGPASSSPRS